MGTQPQDQNLVLPAISWATVMGDVSQGISSETPSLCASGAEAAWTTPRQETSGFYAHLRDIHTRLIAQQQDWQLLCQIVPKLLPPDMTDQGCHGRMDVALKV